MARGVDGENEEKHIAKTLKLDLKPKRPHRPPEKKKNIQPVKLRDNNRQMSMVLCAATLNWSYNKRDIELEFLEQENEMPALEFNATLKILLMLKS